MIEKLKKYFDLVRQFISDIFTKYHFATLLVVGGAFVASLFIGTKTLTLTILVVVLCILVAVLRILERLKGK